MSGPARPRVSLGRALSKLGYASRSQSLKLIDEGRVTLNGTVVTNPSTRCFPDTDRITVDGVRLRSKELVYVLLDKPEGVVTTRSDERGRSTVYDTLGEFGGWLFPVGRLDKESSGLLLLTNDTTLGELLTNPRSKVPKSYLVELDRRITDQEMARLRGGMALDGKRLLPAVVSRKEGSVIEMTIVQGKNRQIRRMCAQIGCEVLALRRIRIGTLSPGGVRKGGWRHLSKAEIRSLYAQVR